MNRWRLLGLASLLLVVLGIGGCFLFPNHPPVASFTVVYGIDESDPLVVQLDASGSTDPDGDDIVSYMWSFGDNVTITPLDYSKTVSVPTITVRYPVEGKFTLTLVVVDSRGAMSDPVTADMEVPPPAQGS
jgi:hypothetical protein